MGRPLSWLLTLLMVMPAAALMPAARAADLSPGFVVQATAVARFEIASSQLALRKTRNDAVQGFASQMVLDYTVAQMKLRQAIAEAKLPAPRDALDATHKALFDQLSHTPPGKPFAKAYLEIQDKALRGDLALFEAYEKSGDNERLKFFAGEMVPVLRGHLEQLAKLHK